MMRHNDFKNDIVNNNEPSLTIAFRYNLRYELELQACYGATDTKFATLKELLEGKNNMHIFSGPNNLQQPTFSWDNTTCENHDPGRYFHEGVDVTWNFNWIDYKFQLVNIQYNDDEDDDDDSSDSHTWIVIVCCVVGSIILIIIIIFILVKRCIRKKTSNDINIKNGEMNSFLTN